MQWTTSCVDVLNEALFGQFLPFDFYRSTPSKQPVDKRLGWLLSDSANTSIGSDFSHNSDIRSVLQGFVFQHNFKETNFCCLIVPVFKIPNELYLTWKCSGCVKVKDAGVVNFNVWRMYLQIWYDQDEFCQLKTCCKAALSTYYVASTSQCTEINFVWWACISLWYAH